jgi:hypothetical protein
LPAGVFEWRLNHPHGADLGGDGVAGFVGGLW